MSLDPHRPLVVAIIFQHDGIVLYGNGHVEHINETRNPDPEPWKTKIMKEIVAHGAVLRASFDVEDMKVRAAIQDLASKSIQAKVEALSRAQ